MATATAFATLPADERRLLFTEAAARLQLAPLILEKDFWVGWLLGRLFALPQRQGHFHFKGGTSLSMVFGAVQRFSEDIDLAILPAALGFDEAYFNDAPSTNQRRKRMEQLAAASETYVQALRPELEADVAGILGPHPAPGWFTYELDAAAATPNLLFHYPSVTTGEFAYVPKRVKMEFGSLTNQQPATRAVARTLIARVLPEGDLADLRSDVIVLDVARTFWEKATILHAEHHRPVEQPIRDRFARHYSDFLALWQHDAAREAALARFDLLADVALHKSRYFASSWANYGAATPGSLRLLPPQGRWPALEADYVKMRSMFLDEPLSFAALIDGLSQAEITLNIA
jgi:hypothetical protein